MNARCEVYCISDGFWTAGRGKLCTRCFVSAIAYVGIPQVVTGQVDESSHPPAQYTSHNTPTNNLRDSNISNCADETPRTQLSTAGCPKTVADAIHLTSRIHVRSLTVCYHTSTTKKTPRTHTIWVSDTTAPKQTKTASIIISEVIVQATGTDTPHHTLLAYVSPTSERFGYTHSATKRLVMTFTSATFYLPS